MEQSINFIVAVMTWLLIILIKLISMPDKPKQVNPKWTEQNHHSKVIDGKR